MEKDSRSFSGSLLTSVTERHGLDKEISEYGRQYRIYPAGAENAVRIELFEMSGRHQGINRFRRILGLRNHVAIYPPHTCHDAEKSRSRRIINAELETESVVQDRGKLIEPRERERQERCEMLRE